jgi:hypothetical protein
MAIDRQEVETASGVNGAQVLLAMLGLVVLVAVLWFVFLRGGPEEVVAVPPVAVSPLPTPEPSVADGGDSGKKSIETFEVFAPKDPFKPLITAGTSASTGITTVGITGAAGGGSSGSVTQPGTGSASGGSDISGGGAGGGTRSAGGHRVRLVDTFRAGGRERARVQVDGTVYTVEEGDRFAENFQLVSISGECASLLFGDDQFSLCEGEEILK